MRLSVLAVPAVLASAALVAVLAAPAGAAPPQPVCGTTLSVSTSLRSDLTCTGPGLTLAPGVTLNLRGHTLSGSGTGTGVSVSAFGATTVTNGTITGWSTGVATSLDGEWEGVGGPLTVRKVTFRDNRWGLDTSGESGTGAFVKPTTVVRSTFDHNNAGLVSAWFSAPVIDRSTFTDNTIGLWSNADATVDRSRFERNDEGMKVYEGGATVSRSRFVDNTLGVTVTAVSGVTITDSRFSGGDVALTGAWEASLDVSGTAFVASGTGVLMDHGSGTFDQNTFTSNGVGFRQASPDGYTVLRDNVFRLNGDGILSDAGDPDLQLGGNTVRRSSGWGIYAPGAVDLGGNTARRNGNEPQCVGVVCAAPTS